MGNMREKKWIDCPVCGATNSMRARKNLSERFVPSGYPPVDISGLDGRFCDECGEGFWSLQSERKIARLLGEHRARHDATRVVAAELASVREAAETLHVTVQGVHKMMAEGRLRYVVAGGSRLPIQEDVAERAKVKNKAPVPGTA
jgi:hypothetical protein